MFVQDRMSWPVKQIDERNASSTLDVRVNHQSNKHLFTHVISIRLRDTERVEPIALK